MTFGDGTKFGFSEPAGTRVTVTLAGIFGIPVTQFTPDVALTLGSFGSGTFGAGTFGTLYTPDIPPIS